MSDKSPIRAAIYARYSTEMQSAASIQDQIRLCRKLCDERGWTVVDIFADEAISGATHLRPGFQELQQSAMNGGFDVIVAESLDRLSRDQEHIAGLHIHFERLTDWRIFDDYAEGVSPRAIAARLNQDGIPPRPGANGTTAPFAATPRSATACCATRPMSGSSSMAATAFCATATPAAGFRVPAMPMTSPKRLPRPSGYRRGPDKWRSFPVSLQPEFGPHPAEIILFY